MALFAMGGAPFLGRCLSILGAGLRVPENVRLGTARITAGLRLAAALVGAIGLVAGNRQYLRGEEVRERLREGG